MSIDTKLTEYLRLKKDFQKNPEKLVLKLQELLKTIENELNKKIDDIKIREKGEKGDQGDKGERGEKGEKGNNGINGRNGKDGKSGRDGKDGVNGKDGKNGKDGSDGQDGSPDKPEEIAKKLNTLEKKIKMKVIDGIEEKFEFFKKAIQNIKGSKGGGGMGNVKHETFNISAGTTSITTEDTIGGNGNAIFCFTYENARLEMTNHYTVGANRKTITFHTDVQAQLRNNTVAAITYMRG